MERCIHLFYASVVLFLYITQPRAQLRNKSRDCNPDCYIMIKKRNQWTGNIQIDCIYQPVSVCINLSVPFLLCDQPNFVERQAVHQAAVVDIALPDYHIRHCWKNNIGHGEVITTYPYLPGPLVLL